MPDPDYNDIDHIATIAKPVFDMFNWEWGMEAPSRSELFEDIENKIRKILSSGNSGMNSGRVFVMKNEDAFDVYLDLGTVRMVQE